MISAADPDSDLVKIFTLALPLLTLLATAYIGYKQSQLKDGQTKLTEHVNGHMTAMLKVTDEAALYRGRLEGAQEKKAEIRADAQEAKVGVAATDKKKGAVASND